MFNLSACGVNENLKQNHSDPTVENPLWESTNVLLVEQPATHSDTSSLANEEGSWEAVRITKFKPLASEDALDGN